MRRELFFAFFMASVFLLKGQQWENLANPKENIHLHLNKTTFLQGERLWFKAYIRDQNTKRPSLETTNLHVGIYGDDGEEVKRKLLYVENGMAHGDFAMDSTLTDTRYTVLAWTNYMRNFKELEPFRQQIKILKDGMEQDSGEANMTISVYPEGGQLIAGAYNNIGILVDNGFGQALKVESLQLVDETGNVIQRNIKTNDLGMGKTGFKVEPDKIYYLQITDTHGTLIRQKLPEGVKEQFGIRIDNKQTNKVLIEMVGAPNTFALKEGDTYSFAVYQDNFIGFEDFEVDINKPIVWFNRNQMPNGIITAVLFDENLRPIAHRIFFNHREYGSTAHLNIEHCFTEWGDSIQVDFILRERKGQIANLSISALPVSSRAYDTDNSIISSFWVKPYTRKDFKNHYFLELWNKKRRFELDNRLLIEGWGRYDWDSRTLKEVQDRYEMESGIFIKGQVLNANLKRDRQVSLTTELPPSMQFEELQSDGFFERHMMLYKGDSLGVSLINGKGELKKPKAKLLKTSGLKVPVDIQSWMVNKTLIRQKDQLMETDIDQPLNIDERTIALEGVTVTESLKKDNKFQISPLVEGRWISDSEIKRYPSLTTYLANLGFAVAVNRFNGNISYKLYQKNHIGVEYRVPLFVEGVPAVPEDIGGIPLSKVLFLTYSKTPPSPFISITLNPDYKPPTQRNAFIKFLVEEGYTKPQDYFTPDYPTYDSSVFKSYGALDWKANISVGAEVPTSITIPLKDQTGIQLYIEGMGADGRLVSKSETVFTSEVMAKQ